MTDIFVSDILGYIINNQSPFIIIKSSEIYKFLTKINQTSDKSVSIWEYKKDKINNILKDRNADPNQFLTMGNILYKQNTFKPSNLLLGNMSICKNPNSFQEVLSYEGGKIVKPIISGNSDYEAIGLFYVKNGDTLDYNSIGLLPKNMIMSLDNIIDDDISINDFGLLSYYPNGIKTINRNKLFTGKKNIKLLSTSNKYLTMTDTNDLKQKSKKYSSKQTFSYNAQGELTNEDKCLTFDPKDMSVYFDLCGENKTQKWNILEQKISPVYKFDKCLSSDTSSINSDDISLETCQSNATEQQWNTEPSDMSTSGDYVLPTYGGKVVVLVENDNPFYLNKENTIQST